jgi:chromate transport protein ChrA
MERNVLLLLLLITGCIVCLVGFVLAQFFPALFIVALIIIAFLYLDFQESHKSGRRDLKKNASVAVFVIVTFYCMITGWWIFWAGITAMLYIDALVDSTREWLDARHLAYLDALKTMQSPGSESSGTLQSVQQSILDLEQRVNALEKNQ